MTTSPTLHQTYLKMPKLDSPVVNSDGTMAPVWQRLIIGLYNRLGGSMLAQPNATFTAQAPIGAGAPLAAFNSNTGAMIGVIPTNTTAGGPAQPQTLASSPFLFTAAVAGTLIVASGKVEISRDSGSTWYTVGLQGGPVPVLMNDQVLVSWTGSAPQVTLLPSTVTQ